MNTTTSFVDMTSSQCAIIFLAVLSACTAQLTRKVLLVSLDGFRWDYLDKTDTPNFDSFVDQGVRVKQVRNVFSTLTFPNHWTLVTGQYEEDTGIIANKMYDPVFQEEFSYDRDTKWYEDTEPIWITAGKESLTTGAYMWVGNQAVYDGKTATKVVPFKSGVDFDVGIEQVVDWFSKDDLNFASLYFNEPDSTGHKYGPDSEEVKDKIREMDALLGRLLQQLDDKGLTDVVNIIIASDHGMASVSNERSIDLSQYVDKEDVEWWYTSVIGHILPKENKTMKIYNALKNSNESHLHVYLKEDIPEELHYKNHRRIMPIFLMTDEGWVMKKSSYNMNLKGNHGFNNSIDDMKSTFVARGPNFKCGYKQDHLEIVDVYPLMCELLGLSTCHQGPGSLDRTTGMITLEDNCLQSSASSLQCTTLIMNMAIYISLAYL